MNIVLGITFLATVWYLLLAVTFVGYAGCAYLSGVPLKSALSPQWAISGVWGLLGVGLLLSAWLLPGLWAEVTWRCVLTLTPGATAVVLLCHLRKRAVMDLPVSVEVLLVLLVSALGFAVSCVLFYGCTVVIPGTPYPFLRNLR